jgi:hypothetical protein
VDGRNGIGEVRTWVERWGFAVLVGVAVSVGVTTGVTVGVPGDVPSFALQAAPVYRVEVGGALFAALYLGPMALVLAFRNQAFTEIGTGGMRAHELGRLPEAIEADRRALDDLAALTAEIGRVGGDVDD